MLDRDLPAAEPPSILFTPVRRKAHYNFLEKVLIKRDNHFYLLTPEKEMAERIGRRKDQRPVILEVTARRAARDGVHFSSFGRLYLAPEIPASHIAGPPVPKSALQEKETVPPVKKESSMGFSPGTFFLDISNDPDKSRRIKGRKKRGCKEEVRGIRRKG